MRIVTNEPMASSSASKRTSRFTNLRRRATKTPDAGGCTLPRQQDACERRPHQRHRHVRLIRLSKSDIEVQRVLSTARSSFSLDDMAEILGVEPVGPETIERYGQEETYETLDSSGAQKARFDALHRETQTAVQVVLQHARVKPGV